MLTKAAGLESKNILLRQTEEFTLSNIVFERQCLQTQSVPFSFFEYQVSWKNKETIKTVLKISDGQWTGFLFLRRFLAHKQVL